MKVYLDFALITLVIAALELRLQSIQQRVAVDVGAVDDHHLPEVEIAQKRSPDVGLVREWRNRPQEGYMYIL